MQIQLDKVVSNMGVLYTFSYGFPCILLSFAYGYAGLIMRFGITHITCKITLYDAKSQISWNVTSQANFTGTKNWVVQIWALICRYLFSRFFIVISYVNALEKLLHSFICWALCALMTCICPIKLDTCWSQHFVQKPLEKPIQAIELLISWILPVGEAKSAKPTAEGVLRSKIGWSASRGLTRPLELPTQTFIVLM